MFKLSRWIKVRDNENMAVKVEIEPTTSHVIFLKFEGTWTWTELYEASAKTRTILDVNQEQTFTIVCDLFEGAKLPQGSPFLYVRNAIKNPQPNVGFVVLASSSPYIKILFDSIKPLMQATTNIQIYHCTSEEQVQQLIENNIQRH
jgi:hypothetical protein